MKAIYSALATLALLVALTVSVFAATVQLTISSTHPSDNCRITVSSSPSVPLTVTAHYKTTTTTHRGTGSVTFDIGRATYGYTVPVDVVATLNGTRATGHLSFTPQRGGPCSGAASSTSVSVGGTSNNGSTSGGGNQQPQMPGSGGGGMATRSGSPLLPIAGGVALIAVVSSLYVVRRRLGHGEGR